MADEREYPVARDDCEDKLSDVPSGIEDCDEEEGILSSEEENEEEDDTEMHSQMIWQGIPLGDAEESVEDNGKKWLDVDLPRNNDAFEGSFGPTKVVKNPRSVEEVLGLFVGDELFEWISVETNKYHNQNAGNRKHDKKTGKFFDVTAVELKKWFGLLILMGIVKKPKINDYWSKNPLLETPLFGKTMSRNRFRQILSYLHFCDNSKMPANSDRLYKVQGIIDYFADKFQENFNLGRNIMIDGAVIPWGSRLSSKVSNPSQVTKYGVFVQKLCDSTTGYVSHFQLFSGSSKPSKDTVTELLEDVAGKWHHLYIDHYYNRVSLAEELFMKKIGFCGTLRHDRGLPLKLKNCKLDVFETKFLCRGAVLAQIWKPTKVKIVRIISTIHSGSLVDTAQKCKKTSNTIKTPPSILDYNKYLKGVNQADQYLSYYIIYHKNIKWAKKVLLYLLNCALYNAFVVYQCYNKGSNKLQFYDFLLKVSECWIKYNAPLPEERLDLSSTLPVSSRESYANRLSGQVKDHQLVRISETDSRKRRRCHVCYRNKKIRRTNLMCLTCGVALHLGDCFAAFHLKDKYYP